MSNQVNKVAFFELPADDVVRASSFYQKVFGWETPEQGGGNVWAFTTKADEHGTPTEPGAINGDFRPRSEGFDRPLIMILVDDVEEKLKEVEASSGDIVHPPQDESQFGGPMWAVFSDTEGNHVGIFSFNK